MQFHRRSIRFKGYDYTKPGYYFLTISARNKEPLFGNVIKEHVELTAIGEVVYDEWKRSAALRNEIELDEFVIMPNHMHGIVRIKGSRINLSKDFDHRGVHLVRMSKSSLSSFVAGFKAVCSSRAKREGLTQHSSIWQRNYYEHIIRSEQSLNMIRLYIQLNPKMWAHGEDDFDVWSMTVEEIEDRLTKYRRS